MIETGSVLQDRYLIDRQIGQGGMGAVYVATDKRFSSTVAIKETLCMDDSYRKAIEREARLLNSLKHVALPRVSDHFVENNGQFLVMEYIPGEDLCCILEETGKPFSVDQVLVWADQLLDALEFLHHQENPVIHRDIKPQNLKITSRGQIILLDFGLAKGNPTDAGNKTAAKSIFGYSRNYASLEQIQGTGTDPRSDLYSLAATLYHLLTFTAPEDALTRAMAVLGNRPDPLIPANQLVEEIPAGVAGILQNALDLSAERRPASAQQMREMLQEHEKYAHLAVAGTLISRPLDADFQNQKTRLMHGETTPGTDRQTDVRTELYPNQLSEVTALRPLKTAESDRAEMRGDSSPAVVQVRRFRRRMEYAAFGILLLAVSVGGGVLFYHPEYIGYANPASDVVLPEVEVPVVDEPSTEAIVLEPPPEVVSVETKQPTQETVAAQKKNPAATSRSAASTDRTKASAESDSVDFKDENVVIKGDTIWVGNMKVKDGLLEMPRKGTNFNGTVPQVHPTGPILPPNFPYLTPEQRRKLKIFQRRQANANANTQP